jgi:hypothetical protein
MHAKFDNVRKTQKIVGRTVHQAFCTGNVSDWIRMVGAPHDLGQVTLEYGTMVNESRRSATELKLTELS